ncbi:MFS transporter [bacterium]|nr:MFS transporter [bacterium]
MNQEEINSKTESEARRNFALGLIQGAFIRLSHTFVEGSTILSAFVLRLTNSSVMVGLVGSMMSAGWMLPQLFISNLIEHKPYKKPFYILGYSIRLTAWSSILLFTLIIADSNFTILFIGFISLYAIATFAMGISTVPFTDIVSKVIPATKRPRFFSSRNFMGGIAGFLAGFLVRHILKGNGGIVFPNNYALLFGFNIIGGTIAFGCFVMIREPVEPVRDKRISFREHLKTGPMLLKTNKDYRMLLIARVFMTLGSMSSPFYVPYALSNLGVKESMIGLFISISMFSGIFSNIAWAYLAEKRGCRVVLMNCALFAMLAPLVGAVVKYIPSDFQIPTFFLIFIFNRVVHSALMMASTTYLLDIAPSETRPTYLGFMNTFRFPLTFAPVLAGFLLKIISYQMLFVITMLFGACAFFYARLLSDDTERRSEE